MVGGFLVSFSSLSTVEIFFCSQWEVANGFKFWRSAQLVSLWKTNETFNFLISVFVIQFGFAYMKQNRWKYLNNNGKLEKLVPDHIIVVIISIFCILFDIGGRENER